MNRESSIKQKEIHETIDLNELNFNKIPDPSEENTVWFLEIDDKGNFDAKSNETTDYVANFFISFNEVTYQSFHHPFFNDGSIVRAEIHGEENEILRNGERTTTYSKVLAIISIGEYNVLPDLNPEQAYDSEAFRAHVLRLGTYHAFWIIDGGSNPTHSKITSSHVSSFLNTIDSVTGGCSQVVLLITGHGTDGPAVQAGFYTYYGWWLWHIYSAYTLKTKLAAMTVEGTRIFLWGHCCNSDFWAEVTFGIHNRLIAYVYTNFAYTGAREWEYAEFWNKIALGISVESMFADIRERFLEFCEHHGQPNDDMVKWDYCSGNFYV